MSEFAVSSISFDKPVGVTLPPATNTNDKKTVQKTVPEQKVSPVQNNTPVKKPTPAKKVVKVQKPSRDEIFDYFEKRDDNNTKRLNIYFGISFIIGIIALLAGLKANSALREASGELNQQLRKEFGNLTKVSDATSKAELLDVSKSLSLDDLSYSQKMQERIEKINFSIDNRTSLTQHGAPSMSNAYLLYGPPGTGKTSLVHALAKKHSADLYKMDLTKLKSSYMSRSGNNIARAIDERCKAADETPNKKIFILIDEIDSVMMTDESTLAAEANNTMNAFKDGFNKLKSRNNITVFAATNINAVQKNAKASMPDSQKDLIKLLKEAFSRKELDAAMLDRFSYKIPIDLPSAEQIEQAIIKHYSNKSFSDVDKSLKISSKNLKNIANTLNKQKASFRDLNTFFHSTANLACAKNEKSNLEHFIEVVKEHYNIQKS